MGLFKRKRAQGGEIRPTNFIGEVAAIGNGTAVVSDAMMAKYGREYFERINGSGTSVYSASEMLAIQNKD